jgi:hypothetical protein
MADKQRSHTANPKVTTLRGDADVLVSAIQSSHGSLHLDTIPHEEIVFIKRGMRYGQGNTSLMLHFSLAAAKQRRHVTCP